ncbi:MAG: hypothetical protein WKF85_10350 [Chitinophagaceae bacterium]
MKTIIKSIAVLLITAVVFTSCKKEPVQVTPSPLSGNGLPVAKNTEYDLDITLNTTYKFYDNISDPWGYDTYSSNFDLTEILGKANLPPLGEFNIYIGEAADAESLSDKIYLDYFSIRIPGDNTPYISGTYSINFKKLIREGGGPFSGTLTVKQGSATRCCPNIFSSPPLQLSGSLNVTTGIVSLTIKGKTYF